MENVIFHWVFFSPNGLGNILLTQQMKTKSFESNNIKHQKIKFDKKVVPWRLSHILTWLKRLSAHWIYWYNSLDFRQVHKPVKTGEVCWVPRSSGRASNLILRVPTLPTIPVLYQAIILNNGLLHVNGSVSKIIELWY